ncbi:Hypothetical predicted protein [Pelobates cultripes]|uniref:Uncharacterized protein n=1 Tax=Pelobates cultripes TaxID=61616 RepID=A0AAD1W2C3_PELCU|nr:Hypothetical predicted protein [Pelobates cultripes]
MGGNRKKRDLTPSVATMFQVPRDRRPPSLSQGHTDSGLDSDDGGQHTDPDTPLTKGDLRQLLREATSNIKAYAAVELEKHITSLRTDIETLTARTNQAETHLTEASRRSQFHDQEISRLHEKNTATGGRRGRPQ